MSETNELSGLALRESVAARVMGVPDGSAYAPDDPDARANFWRGAKWSIASGPAYESDPAACAAMEARIKELGLEVEYVRQLAYQVDAYDITVNTTHGWECYGETDWSEVALVIFATPEQRCRAALATVESK